MKNFQPLFKSLLFCKKLERKRPHKTKPRVRGPGLQHSPWISDEEPLQTSCLGKNQGQDIVVYLKSPRRRRF